MVVKRSSVLKFFAKLVGMLVLIINLMAIDISKSLTFFLLIKSIALNINYIVLLIKEKM